MRAYTLLLGILMAAALVSSGCAIPVSELPLSDEKTSTLDERLIGYWKYVPKDKDEEVPPAPYLIGRTKDQPNVLQMTWVELDDEKIAKVKQTPLYTTIIGDEYFISLTMDDVAGEKEAAKAPFLIARYEVSDEGLAHLFLMKPDEIAAAIEGGKLKGVVKRQRRSEGEDPNKPMPYNEIRITAEPKEMEAFFKTHVKTCFSSDEPVTFQRVKGE